MNREDVIALAKEAGLFVPQAGIPENGALTRFAALVAAAEREACAKVCDELAWDDAGDSADAMRHCAAAIRARRQR
jgi:hypothetical protein